MSYISFNLSSYKKLINLEHSTVYFVVFFIIFFTYFPTIFFTFAAPVDIAWFYGNNSFFSHPDSIHAIKIGRPFYAIFLNIIYRFIYSFEDFFFSKINFNYFTRFAWMFLLLCIKYNF